MIEIANLQINRAIIHHIVEKTQGQEHATVTPRNTPIVLQDPVNILIRKRLIDAAGKESKAFELGISQDGDDSFFQQSRNLESADETEFVEASKEIARMLARTQRRSSIPGGYLLVLGGLETGTNRKVRIVIKAEPHEALKFTAGQTDQLDLLTDVFLSPSQKLFKIGIVYEKGLADGLTNDRYGAFLYDDQFRQDSTPAEYFYRDFLGFDISDNAKIQTKKFFDRARSFIEQNVEGGEDKINFTSALRNQFLANQEATIDPAAFGVQLFANNVDLHDRYTAEVCDELPNAIVKDRTLIQAQLTRRRMSFSGKVNLVGPEDTFDARVSIVDSADELEELDPHAADYTIVKIQGKPYSPNE